MTVALPTSTSAPAGPRSAGRSAAKRKPAAGANPAPTPGKPTCAGRRTRPTGVPSCRWRRGSSLGSSGFRIASNRHRIPVVNGPEPNPAAYLDYLARCRQAFTPFAPIELPDFFAGRGHVIEDIRGELQAPGRQVAIYGERGVGKTSLAVLLYFFAGYDDEHVHIFRCQDDTTFDDICRDLLIDAGQLLGLDGAQAETGKAAEGRLGPLSGSVARRTTVTYRSVRDSRSITLGGMLEAFGQLHALLIIDEFDHLHEFCRDLAFGKISLC